MSETERDMADTHELSWDALLGVVRADFPEIYRSWFDSLRVSEPDGGVVRVEVDDLARTRYLRDRCTQPFVDAIMAQTGYLVSIQFVCDDEFEPGLIPEHEPAGLSQMPISPDYTFDQFVVGASNRLAHAACRAATAQPGTLYNPLFIHGESGLGKTHLLQAICAAVRRADPPQQAVYVTCETFVNDFVRAIEQGTLPQFRDSARRADVLVIDDVQFLANRESSQEEFFHTFNVLYQSRRQIIISADSPPTEIPTLEDRLISRFNWGLVAQIDPPNRETRQAILHKKARLRGCEVPDEVLDLIAERVQSNVRTLEGALTKLMLETQIGGKPMTLETAEQSLGEFDGRSSRPIQVSDILDGVSRYFGIRVPELVGRKRSRSVSFPRQIGMYLARKLTPLSLEEIGSHFGGRDHSTVLHAERVIEASREQDRSTADALTELTRQLLAKR
jgi:chromosomal replication initiator protein